MSKVLALRFTFALLFIMGFGSGIAHADAIPFIFNFGVGTSTFTFETYSLTEDISVHCLAGCPGWDYVNYFPSSYGIEFGAIDDTKGAPYAKYGLPQDFFTLGCHRDGIYSMDVTQVPEPATLTLFVIGLLGIVSMGRYRASSESA